jgi:hypothetical protein
MPGLGGRGAAGAGATSAGLEAAAALDFGAAALRGVGFAFLAADFGALFLAAECFFFRDRAALFAFFVFLVFDFVFFAMIVLPIVRHYSVRFNRVAVQLCLLKTSSIGGPLAISDPKAPARLLFGSLRARARGAYRRQHSSIVLGVFWFNAAAAQEGYLGHHDKWHRSFYQMLLRPDTKTPCCNLTDCRPTSGKRVDDHYEVKVNGPAVLRKVRGLFFPLRR